MRPIAVGGVAATASQLFFSALLGRRSDAIPGSHALPSITSQSQHRTDNNAPLALAHQLLQCGSNAIIDSPAESELWTFQEPRATSGQHKRFDTVLSQYLTYHYATRDSPYITTLHTCRERIRY